MKEEKYETSNNNKNEIDSIDLNNEKIIKIAFSNNKKKTKIFNSLKLGPLDFEKDNKKFSTPTNKKSKFEKMFFPSHKNLLIDTNILNLNDIKNNSSKKIEEISKQNEETNKSKILKNQEKNLEFKNQEIEIIDTTNKVIKNNKKEEEKIIKYYTPTKERKKEYITKIYKEGIKIIKKIRKEKNIIDKKPKHQHKEKKDRDEEIHMSDFKPQNKENKENREKMEILGEEEEEVVNQMLTDEEKKELKENDNKDKTMEKNNAINEFLKDLENKNKNEINEKNKIEEESDDPFEKAENEYRIQHNEFIEDEDDIIKNIDLDIEEKEEEDNKKEKEKEKKIIENKENQKEGQEENEEKMHEEKDKEKEVKEEEKEEEKKEENTKIEKEDYIENEKNMEKSKDEKKVNESIENNQNINKNYLKTYLNSLNKKSKNFNPLIGKRPANIYLKEIYQYQNYREKMKKYNRKTGKFEVFINKTNINKIISKEGNLYHDNYDSSKENIVNNTLYHYKNFSRKFNNKFINDSKNNNTSLNTFPKKYLINTIHTSSTNKRKNILKDKEKRAKTEANINIKKDNNIKDMMHLLLQREIDKANKKLIPINKRRNSEQKDKIIKELNDPYNPYSTIWHNKFLNINYNSRIEIREKEQGVPQLKVKEFKKNNLPPLYFKKSSNFKDKLFCSPFSSTFNKNFNVNANNCMTKENQRNKNKEEDKEISKYIAQKENNQNINDLHKVLENINNNNNKNESEIIEEEFN